MKLFILGHARHGKDTVAEILMRQFGLSFMSSSQFVAEKAVRPYLRDVCGITYPSFEIMYADRVNHRDKWYTAIDRYNTPDRARLASELFAEYDMYVGIRNQEEFLEAREQKLYDFAFWVDRSLHVAPEPETSNTMKSYHADYIIDNNGSLEYLEHQVVKAVEFCQMLRD